MKQAPANLTPAPDEARTQVQALPAKVTEAQQSLTGVDDQIAAAQAALPAHPVDEDPRLLALRSAEAAPRSR